MPAVLWTRYWLDFHGYDVQEKNVYQDNISAIILEKNCKSSISKRTNHIKTRYYLLGDIIEKYKLSLEWCPTSYIIGYFTTKPTEGATFKRFRDQLMGFTEAK